MNSLEGATRVRKALRTAANRPECGKSGRPSPVHQDRQRGGPRPALCGGALLAGAEPPAASPAPGSPAISDGAILNFALNLEYLEAEFYSHAVYGHGLPSSLTR